MFALVSAKCYGGLTFFWTHCIYSIMKTKDTEALRKQRAKPSKSINLYELLVPLCSVHHYNSIQYCNTETVFFSIFPFSRSTSRLRCGQVEVRCYRITKHKCSKSSGVCEKTKTKYSADTAPYSVLD